MCRINQLRELKLRQTFIIFLTCFLVQQLLLPVYVTADQMDIPWTEAELEFMENHHTIKMGVDPEFKPFEFIEDGQYKGIAHDILSIVSEKTGLQFDVRDGLSLPEAYDLVLEGELDALPAIGKTVEREDKFLFSKPYYNFKRIIAINNNSNLTSVADFKDLPVAVQRNSSHHSYLIEHPYIELNLYDSIESALVAVSTGEEVAFIGNLASSNYSVKENGLSNIKFISFESDEQRALHFAVNKDLPELVTIFDKAIGTITESEWSQIRNRWVNIETETDYGPMMRVISIIVGLFILIIGVSLFWIIRLRKEIRKRKMVEDVLVKVIENADQMNEKLQHANAELEKMSWLDGLTGIFNRRYFDHYLETLWENRRKADFPLALIMIDIDRFKRYNDTYGHLAGDECLRAIVVIMDEMIGDGKGFLARYGGEEFGVVLANTTEQEAMETAERIRIAIEKAIIYYDQTKTSITVSLGIAIAENPQHMSSVALVEQADQALYEAKRMGRNRSIKANVLKQDNLTS